MAPSTSVPGPHVDHVAVMARWWDRWLRDVPNGVDAEPPVTVFVRSYAAARAGRRPVARPLGGARPARAWTPSATSSCRSPARCSPAAGPVAPQDVPPGAAGPVVAHDAARDVGAAAWNSCAASLPWGQPLDQREDEARSLCADVDLPAGTVVLGHPLVRRPGAADGRAHPRQREALPRAATAAARACSWRAGCWTSPTATATGPRRAALVPGEWVDVEIEVEATAFEVTAGHRLRLALAAADWPNTVAPQSVWSMLDLGSSSLVLPVAAGSPHRPPTLPDPSPSSARGRRRPGGDSSHVQWQHGYDVLTRTRYSDVDHGATYGAPHGARCTEHYVGHVEVDARTGEQTASGMCRYEVEWPQVSVRSVARLLLHVDADAVTVDLDLDVDADGEPVARRRWQTRVDRRLP